MGKKCYFCAIIGRVLLYPVLIEMNVTIANINHLLSMHRIVAVPDFGVFSRRYIGASASPNGHLAPPEEAIVFEACPVDVNDCNLLLQSVARQQQSDLAQAMLTVRDDVKKMCDVLDNNRYLSVGNFGNLYQEDGTTVFIPQYSESYPYSCLQPITSIASSIDARGKRPAISGAVTKAADTSTLRSIRSAAQGVAAIAILVFIAFVASQLSHFQTVRSNQASFGVDETILAATDGELSNAAMPSTSEGTLVLIVRTPDDGMSIVEPNEHVVKADEPKNEYYLIVASLASEAEAQKYIESQDVENMGILSVDGRWRVYAATGDSYSSVESFANKNGLYNIYPSAWIVKR